MALNFGLIKKTFDFDDTGNLLVNSVEIFQKAKLTITTLGAAKKIIMNMYDRDTSTYCEIGSGDTGSCDAKWEFQGKPKFNQLNATVYANGNDNRTFYLEGSNNDADWVEIDTIGITSTDGTYGMDGTDVNYKYIRIRCVTAGNSVGINIAGISGTT